MIERNEISKCIAIAILGLVFPTSSSYCAIVYSEIQNETMGQGSGENVDITLAGAVDPFRVADERGSYGVFGVFEGSYSILVRGDPIDRIVVAFDFGETIGSGLEWRSLLHGHRLAKYEANGEFGTGEFFHQSDRYLPVRTEYDSDEYFGWLRLSHSLEDEMLTIHDWAWNSVPGEPILAGEIPEPRVYALMLGLGVLGLVLWRRRSRGI